MLTQTNRKAAPARNHLPCTCCRRYTLSTDLSDKGLCRDCKAELDFMDARAERFLSTMGEEKEDTY